LDFRVRAVTQWLRVAKAGIVHRNISTIFIYAVCSEIVSWVRVMLFNRWARKELERGDLGTLSELSSGGLWGEPNPGRMERLNRRGFVVRKANDKPSVTLKGRIALWIRRRSG
jgi:hypothetical protein